MKSQLSLHLVTAVVLAQVTMPLMADFESTVLPILKEHCYECHSHAANKAKGGLVLDSRSGWETGGESGPAIVPGDVASSLLLQAVTHGHDKLKMPPDDKLDDHAIKILTDWIRDGAKDPRVAQPTPVKALWSFKPVDRVKVPDVGDTDWPVDPIDHFVLAKLEQQGLSPSVDLDSRRLLRRIHFDLIGLPPTVEQLDTFVDAFKRDPLDALASKLDELLDSPRFGERWGRHWLDVARFAESNGGDRNVIYPHAWRYRRYVIDSFNRDTPFDQFVREQIAGDLLPIDDQDQRDRRLIATGLLTLGPKLFMETKSEQFRMDRVDEQIDVITRGILGLSVSCARCHDHKFDSVTTKDYYALAGIFRSTYLLYGTAAPAGNQYGHDRPLQPIGKDGDALHGPASEWLELVAKKTAERNKARSDRYGVVRANLASENEWKKRTKGLSPDQIEADESLRKLKATIDEQEALIKEWDRKIEKLDEALKAVESAPPSFPDYCMAVRDDEKVEDCRIRVRGRVTDMGDAVPRGFIEAIQFNFDAQIPKDQSGRLQLANWLTDPRNPLTARVAVNRIWQRLFKHGLVRTVDNFGVTGERPTHLHLLDHLAGSFVQDGWSVKRMIRRVMLSRTYRMDSRPRKTCTQRDPENRLLWRQNTGIMDVESLRDAIMFIAGTLDLDVPEQSVIASMKEPEFNARIRLLPEHYELTCRTVYLPVVRFHLPPMFTTFDFADPSLVVGQRDRRLMPRQQLFFLNNPWLRKQSDAAADRLVSELDDNRARIQVMFKRVLGRVASDEEIETGFAYLKERSDRPTQAWSRYCQVILGSAAFRMIE